MPIGSGWKSTYDVFATKEAAEKDAARRRREAQQNGSGRTFAVVQTKNLKGHGGFFSGSNSWTVMYKEPK